MGQAGKLMRVGKYQTGSEYVTVFLTNGQEGSWSPCGIEGYDEPCMVLGADWDDWNGVYDTMVHEAMEAATVRLGTHYRPTAVANNDLSSVIMVLTHSQMSEVATRVAMFTGLATDDINRAWRKWKKNGKR